jgi:hypothetical protein
MEIIQNKRFALEIIVLIRKKENQIVIKSYSSIFVCLIRIVNYFYNDITWMILKKDLGLNNLVTKETF